MDNCFPREQEYSTVHLPEGNWRIAPARRLCAVFRKFSKKNSCIARARRARPGLKGPRPDLTMTGRCPLSSSAGSSKIKNWTSSRHKADLFLWRDEFQNFDFR
jgi:hypothetical protein